MARNISFLIELVGQDQTVGELIKVLDAFQGLASGAVDAIKSLNNQIFDLFVGQNERLQQEVLSTQSSLVATTDVFRNQELIVDPTEAILALEQPIKEAIETIRRDSLELVGVTSSELVPLFQILASNTQAIADQSSEWADPIDAAGKLTIDFAATLGTLGVPLVQARQEINSILQGTIDQNSVIAKSLNLNNQQVQQWKQQGVLVDELRERLQPFVEGNALAARSISGITSNIQEVFEIITRETGEPLFEDIVDQLEKVYVFIQENQEAIKEGLETAVNFVRELLNTLIESITEVAERLKPLLDELLEALGQGAQDTLRATGAAIELLAGAAIQLVIALEPLIKLLTDVLEVLNETGLAGEIIATTAVLISLNIAFNATINALTLLAPALTAATAKLAAFFTLVKTEGVVGLAAQLGTLTARLQAFSASLVIGLPALALFAAGLAAVAIAVKTRQLKQATDDIDSLARTVKQAGDETFGYAARLKELNELEARNGQLTEEQEKKRANLISISKEMIAQNQAQIEDLKNLEFRNASHRRSVEALIQQLEISNGVLSKQARLGKEAGDSIDVQSKALEEQGTAYDQINDKLEGYLTALRRGTGETGAVSKTAKETVGLIQQQLEAGVISTAEALRLLEEVGTNTKLNYEAILAAQRAAFKALETEVKRIGEAIKQEETQRLIDLQQLLNEQLITEADFNRRRSQLKTESIKQELEAEKQKLAAIDRLELSEEEKQEERRKAIAKTTELQLKLLEQERAERKTLNGLIEEKIDLETRAIARNTNQITSGLVDQQEQYKVINAQIQNRVKASEAIVRNLQTETRLIQSVQEVERARSTLATTELDIRVQEIERSEQKLRDKASDLQKELNKPDTSERRRVRIENELEDLAKKSLRLEEKNESKKEELARKRLRIIQQAQEEEEKRARKLLEIDIARQAAAAQRAALEARIAENQARTNLSQQQQANLADQQRVVEAQGKLETAIASGEQERIAQATEDLRLAQEKETISKTAIDLAGQQIKFAGESLAEAQKQVDVEEQLAINRREVLDLQQKASAATREAEARALGLARNLERGAKATVTIAEGLNNLSVSDLKQLGFEVIEGRREGGLMEADTPYWVGEGAGGKLIPGVSEIVVPKTTSYAIAADKAQEWLGEGRRRETEAKSNSYELRLTNYELLNAVNGLRNDIQSLETGDRTTIEGVQFINQITKPDNKAEMMQFSRMLVDTLQEVVDES